MFANPQLTPALLLALLSGAAALAHETIWTRRLVDLLGASSETFSKVVGAFFLGLALGAWLASRSDSSGRHAWRRVAVAEFAVALLALPVLFSPAVGDVLFRSAVPSALLKLVLPLLLVAPPAIAMGFVLPWMLRAATHGNDVPRNESIWLYAANTFGGLCGIAAVLLLPVPGLGLTRTGLIVCGVNLVVAALALLLDSERAHSSPKKRAADSHPTPADRNLPGASMEPGDFRWLAFASGFLVLSLEVLLQHQLAQITINSLFSGGLVLALVLASLAVSAAFIPGLVQWLGQTKALRAALGLAILFCAAQPFLFTHFRPNLAILPYELTALPYTWKILKLGAVSVGPMIFAAGLVFPLLLRASANENSRTTARRVAALLAWSGVGGWLGTEFTQGWLAPRFGLWVGVEILAAGYLAVWAIFELRIPVTEPAGSRRANGTLKIPAAIALAALVVTGAWFARNLPQVTLAPGEKLATVKVGREGVVAAVDCGPGDWRILFNNSYTLGGSKAQFNQERQGLLPLLLHGNAKSVAILGVATGGTVAGVTLHPSVQQVAAVELSPLVLRFADEYFTPFNRNVFRDPRVSFIVEDARWVIARNANTYDVVVGDLFLPWRTGEGRLFAIEHFQNVRRSLKPDGLFCQWLPLFQLTRPQFDAIARTFREVFPDAFLVRGDFYCELPIVGLVGGRSLAQINWRQVETNCAQLRAEGKATDPLVRHAAGVAMMTLGPLSAPDSAPVNTLANAWLEWDAAKNILGMRTPWFIGVPSAEYLRTIYVAGQTSLPPEMQPAHESGQFFLTLEIAAKTRLTALDNLKRQIPDRLPAALRTDPDANWQQWPSRVKPFPSAPIND